MIEQLFINGVVAASVYSLVALSFAVIYQSTRFFSAFANTAPADRHFAHGAIYTFGAYTSTALSASA